MGFDRTDKLLEHRNVLAPDNILFQVANERFRTELGVVCSDLTNEETLLVIRTLEASTPEDKNVPVLFGKGIISRSMLLRAEMIAHLAPLSVALSRVDPKHFGEWQCESLLGAINWDAGLLTTRQRLDSELAMATWFGYDRRGNITDPRINHAAGHLLGYSLFGGIPHVVGEGVSVDHLEESEWYGANWERIVPLWNEIVQGRELARVHVEKLLSEKADPEAA